jgi:hypothetical protein
MRQHRFTVFSPLLFPFLVAASLGLCAQPAATPGNYSGLMRAQKEEFLLKAKIVKYQAAKKGITNTLRATLSDGTTTHDASIQRIDETKRNFEGGPYGTEMFFRDSWKYNVAAYRLDKLLGLNMIPATVERSFQGTHGSFSWWVVEDVQMDEETRQNKKLQAPDQVQWNREMHIVNLFNQLVCNYDLNKTNLLIDKDWRIWMIDFSRAFRSNTSILEPKLVVLCDSGLLAKLKQLDDATVKKELGPYVESDRIKGLLARRDKIVKFFEDKGESALFSIPRRPE